MPNSLKENAVADVRAFLEAVLPDAHLTNVAVNPEYRPLLLVRTKHVMAAFAFSREDVPKSYEILYADFKEYYAAQQGQWDNLDLAFVFCFETEFPQLDQFCSTVETDVYFCRKFVVQLHSPLDASLARLPFLPLTPLHGHSLRPASAQTFLQQCNIPAVLARFLVVPHARSPVGIVEDCVTGKFGEPPPPIGAISAPVTQTDLPINPVRLEALEIRNFRAYRKPQTFVLGADVTVLYGPNGFGKTSFFDAIDFAVTGGIGRIESRSHSDFAKTAQHLDSGSEESIVSLTFSHNGAFRKITRNVGDRKQALLDNQLKDRKAILIALTSGNIPAADRVENFVSLFRASHLFSYEQQELTKDFQDDCRLSEEIVSRMLAFEDYANAVTKAARVRDVVQSAVADASQQIRVLTEQISSDNQELERLGRTAKVHTNLEALDVEIESLRGKLETAGIATGSTKPNATTIRGWRAALESQHSQTRAAIERLSLLAKEVAALPGTRAELAALQLQLNEKEQTLKVSEEKRIAAELAIQPAEQRLAEMTAKRVEAQVRADLLEWIRNTQPHYAQLIARQQQLNVEWQHATDELTQLRLAEDKAVGELHSRETAAAQAAEKLKVRREELSELEGLRETVPVWYANRTRLSEVLQSEHALVKASELLRARGRELAPQSAAAGAEEARLIRQISEADKDKGELRILISQLQGHVRTGTCPLCGEDHGSKEKLLQRIQTHVASDAASAARADLTNARERAKQFSELVATNKQQQQGDADRLSALEIERTRLETEIARFSTVVSKLAITVEETDPRLTDQLELSVTRAREELAELGRLSHEAEVAAETARASVTNAKHAVAAKKTETDERKAALSVAQEESNRLRADSRLTRVSFDIRARELAELEKLNLTHLEGFRTEAAKAEAEANQKKPEMSMLRQEVSSLKVQLSALRTQLSNLQNIINQIGIRLEEAALPAETTEDSMLVLIAEQSRFQAQLLALRDVASSLELAMDAATTAAALTTLKQTVRNREEAVVQATTTRDRHFPWIKHFDEVSKLVSSQQNDAIANFTREYGPRASVIQRRLRTVYGFDEIEIRSRESTISVRVKRRGEELRPTDYFSQSQQQTLLLGLFLTASSSQTWSAFSPVLLDDPVTHFDDLNTYAFLDLLVGLLESELEKRQFVVSTCDEKFLQLARQKFRHLGDRAKFYRFTSIGADGPTIEETV